MKVYRAWCVGSCVVAIMLATATGAVASESTEKAGEDGTEAAARATTEASGKLLDDIARARTKITSLEAAFDQTRRIGLLATDVTSRGKVLLVRPDRLRWELLPPEAMTYWVGPEGLSFASPTTSASVDKRTAGALGEVMEDLLVFLAGDIKTLHQRYDLRATSLGGEEDNVLVQAKPKGVKAKQVVQRVEFTLGKDRVRPVEVKVYETDTDFVRIRFRDVKTNVSVDAAKMRPAGKEIK